MSLVQDLEAAEEHLKQIIASAEFTELSRSGYYLPETSLADAVTAVQEALGAYGYYLESTAPTNILILYPSPNDAQ